ncbi:pyruvate dehydrogenase E1 component alpha subunit [Actinoplanes derwentensis]|uniref:Pyruvate dehydrogenase E1 component alpha subunit n=2 Tax=Actinoplanes derwentensis TaxID=113562 RepID=A0A1H2DCU8_9ACTN|nr:pyruvate dehydrogenase E1 component alpha subunit [Actinoplanes derwentensis]
MLLIRRFEERLLELFGQGLITGTTHTCIGQEYVPVALAPLTAADYVFSNHRGHGHFLARFDDPVGLLAEILGREGGLCNGVGGSQHLYRGDYLSTGVQGQSLPVAAGVALHLRRHEPGRVAVAYIGDGTWGEGAVYEGLNLAALWKLPLLVVVENNGIAQSTFTARQMSGSIAGRAAAFGIRYHKIVHQDVRRIRAEVSPLLTAVRDGEPAVVEFVTHRIGPHSKGDDSRGVDEVAAARAADWAQHYRAACPERFARTDERQRARLSQIEAEVLARPRSAWTGAGAP